MSIRRGKHKSEYALIPNAVVNDIRLSFEARGLLLYLLAKPEDWCVRAADLCKQGGIGRNKAYRLLSDLEKAGYLVRERGREDSGRFGALDYVVFDDPNMQCEPRPQNQHMVVSPSPQKRDVDKPSVVNGHHTKDRDSTNTRKIQTTEEDPSIEKALSEYHLIAEQAGLAKTRGLSKTRLSHLRSRLKQHGLDAWLAAVRSIPDSPFLRGENNRNWKLDFDWLTNETNFLKLIEGRYHDGVSPLDREQLALVLGGESMAARIAREEQAVKARRLASFHDKGVWNPAWGDRPQADGGDAPVPDVSRETERMEPSP